MTTATVEGASARCSVNRWAVLYCMGAALLFSPGCTATTQPAKETTRTREPVRFAPRQTRPMERPALFVTDFAHPRFKVFNEFSWNNSGCTWTLKFPSEPGAHAGIVFRPVDNLPVGAADCWLTFEVSPPYMCEYIAFALLDEVVMKDGRLKRASGSRTEQVVSAYVKRVRGDWGFVAIPLDAFVTDLSGTNPERNVIRGLRVENALDGGPRRSVVVRRLAFQMRGLRVPRWYTTHGVSREGLSTALAGQ